MYDPESNQYHQFMGQKNFEAQARLGFIRKVFGILTFQLAITTIICLISMYNASFAKFQTENVGVMIFVSVLSIVSIISLVCCKSMAQKVPNNYVIMIVFTLCESYMVSFACSQTDPNIVLMAAVMTLGITVSLTLYAMTTKSDFTMCGASLFICSMALLLFGLFAGILGGISDTAYIVYCAIGVIFYGFYLVYDVQLLVGGKTHEFSMDDYVIASVAIYLDIIIIFLKLMQILSKLKK